MKKMKSDKMKFSTGHENRQRAVRSLFRPLLEVLIRFSTVLLSFRTYHRKTGVYLWTEMSHPKNIGLENPMRIFLLRWLINTVSLFVVVNIIPGITVSSWATVVAAALVLGLLNAFLRPLILLLTLPVNLLTLGLFTLLVNAFMFYLASVLVKGFRIEDFGHAFLGALVFSVISFLLNMVIRQE
jgi:putative membrane protein